MLACLETLIDLVLGPGWNNDYRDFDKRQVGIERLRELIESEQILLYIPSILIAAVHTAVSVEHGIGQAHRVVQKLIHMSSNVEIDAERVLEQTNKILLGSEDGLDFHEGILLPYASALQADAIVARRPQDLNALSGVAPQNGLLTCEIPVLSLNAILALFAQRGCFHGSETVFVMTPRHRVIRLPRGSTPIDFAYKIHSELGDRCERALVNDVEVPLHTKLRTGDVVRIEEGNRSAPDLAWLQFVQTRLARKLIRRGLKRSQRNKGWEKIKELLGHDIRPYRHKLQHVAQRLNLSLNQLVIKVETGETDLQTLQALMAEYSFQPISSQPITRDSLPEVESIILEGRPCKLASCCKPFPNDGIMAVLGKNDGTLWIHCSDCQNLENINPIQKYPLFWNCQTCWVQISLLLIDKADTLRPLLNRLVDEYGLQPDLRSASSDQYGQVWVVLKLNVSSRQHLKQVVTQIKSAPEVRRVKISKVPPISWSDGCVLGKSNINVMFQ